MHVMTARKGSENHVTKAPKTDHDLQTCTNPGKATKPKTYQIVGDPVHCFRDEFLRSSQSLLSSPTGMIHAVAQNYTDARRQLENRKLFNDVLCLLQQVMCNRPEEQMQKFC